MVEWTEILGFLSWLTDLGFGTGFVGDTVGSTEIENTTNSMTRTTDWDWQSLIGITVQESMRFSIIPTTLTGLVESLFADLDGLFLANTV